MCSSSASRGKGAASIGVVGMQHTTVAAAPAGSKGAAAHIKQ
jgi:hypothetical protein